MRSSPVALLFVASMLGASCAGAGSDASSSGTDAVATNPSTESSIAVSEPATSEPPVSSEATADYDQLLEAAEDADPAAIVQVSLAQLSTILGPITGAARVDREVVPSGAGTMALARLAAHRDLLSAEQRDEITALLADLDAASTVVYTSDDDPEYAAALQAAIDSGLTGPAGFAGHGIGHAGHGFAGDRMVEQLDEDSVNAVAQASLRFLTTRLGGVPINMTVAVVPPSTLRPDELALTTGGIRIGAWESDVVPGSADDRDPERRVCSVKIGDYGQLQTDLARRRSVIAHEVFHCWQFANVNLSSQRGLMPPFYFEGSATWAGEQYAVGSSYGAEWAGAFWAAGHFNIRRTDYPAFGFWGQIAQLRDGPDGLWGALPGINRSAVNGLLPSFTAAISGLDDSLVAQLASTAAGQPEWGADWSLNGVPSGRWEIMPVDLGGIASVRAGVQRLVSYSLDGGSDADWYVVEYRGDGFTNAHWAGGETFATTTTEVKEFCSNGSCACPDGTTPLLTAEPLPGDSSSIDVALTGVAPPGSSVQITIRTSEEMCDPVLTLPPSDAALVGTWRADPVSIEVMFESASRLGGAEPLDFRYGSGDLILELSPNGFGSITYTDVQMFVADAGGLGPVDYTLSGKSDFAYSITGGQLLISDTDYTISVGSSLLGDDPLVLTDEDIAAGGGGGGGTTTFVIGSLGPALLLREAEGSQGAVYFPQTWYPV